MNRDQHQDRADEGVQEELDRRVDPPLAPPHPDQEVHRDEDQLPEDVEEEQVGGEEHADHRGLEDEHEDHELLHVFATIYRVIDQVYQYLPYFIFIY